MARHIETKVLKMGCREGSMGAGDGAPTDDCYGTGTSQMNKRVSVVGGKQIRDCISVRSVPPSFRRGYQQSQPYGLERIAIIFYL